MKINKDNTWLTQKEESAISVTKRVWAKPTVELISVESGSQTSLFEQTVPSRFKPTFHS